MNRTILILIKQSSQLPMKKICRSTIDSPPSNRFITDTFTHVVYNVMSIRLNRHSPIHFVASISRTGPQARKVRVTVAHVRKEMEMAKSVLPTRTTSPPIVRRGMRKSPTPFIWFCVGRRQKTSCKVYKYTTALLTRNYCRNAYLSEFGIPSAFFIIPRLF